MSNDPREAAQLVTIAAVLPEELRAPLAAALITVIASDSGTGPANVALEMARSVAWATPEEWAGGEADQVARTVRNARAMYRVSEIRLERKAPQG